MAGISNRPNRSGKTLQAIIDIVSEGAMHRYVWISKNYSQADLIDDLNSIMVEYPLFVASHHEHVDERLNRLTPAQKQHAEKIDSCGHPANRNVHLYRSYITNTESDVDDMSLEPSLG